MNKTYPVMILLLASMVLTACKNDEARKKEEIEKLRVKDVTVILDDEKGQNEEDADAYEEYEPCEEMTVIDDGEIPYAGTEFKKPVIYLYPREDETYVYVRLSFNGEITHTIPEIQGDSWFVTADKDGTITYGGKTYPYLFWEGEPYFKCDFYTGYCIKGEETEAFLRDILPGFGLSDSEMQDFIDYWVPQMEGSPYNMISFQEKTYTENAALSTVPNPDTLIRVFMAWYPSDRFIKISPQIVESPERDGFVVVEWGGCKVK